MREPRRALVVLLSSVLVAAGLGLVAAASPVSADAEQEPASAPGQLLVGYGLGASSQDRADARAQNGARLLERVVRGDSQTREVELVALPSGANRDAAIRRFESNPNVAYAEPNWVLTHDASSNDPYYTGGNLWGMYGDATSPANQNGSQAGEAWASGNIGHASVVVGVIDEGIDFNHPDLAANIWTNPHDPVDGVDNDGNGYVDDVHGWDFYSDNNTVYDGGNHDKHGTHVAGTIAGVGANGTGVAGVAWQATLVSLKFLGPNGGYTSGAVKAVKYLTDLKTRHGMNVVASNNSWGGGGYSQSLYDAIQDANNRGILFVAAAGNSDVNTDTSPHYPSSYTNSNIISVASITSSGAKSSFSNYGATSVDLGAPGSSIYSTLPGNSYGSYSGTSMASPHVTGGAVLAAASGVSGDENIKSAILASAVPTSSMSGKTVTGGRLNVSGFAGSGTGGGSAEPTTGTLTGTVTDDDTNAGIPGALVSLSNGQSAITNSSGGYSLDVAGGTYSVTFSASDFTPESVTGVSVTNGSTTTLNAALTPESPSGGGISLTARGYKIKGVQHADLTWSGAAGTSVDVYRSGSNVATTTNDGAHTDNINRKGGGSYTYKVCETGTSTCSNEVTVTF